MSLAPEVGIRAQAPATDPRPFHLHCLTCPSRWPPSTVPLGGTPGLEGLRSHPAPRAGCTGSSYWEVHPSVTRSKTDCVSVMHWTPTTQVRRRPGHCPQQFPQGSGQSWGRQTHRHIHTDSMIPADRRPHPAPPRTGSVVGSGVGSDRKVTLSVLSWGPQCYLATPGGSQTTPTPTPSPAPSTSSAGSRKGPQSRPRWAWESHSASWGLGVLIHEVGRTMARRPSSQSNHEHLPSARCVAGRGDPAQTTLPPLRKVKVTGGDRGGPRTSHAC